MRTFLRIYDAFLDWCGVAAGYLAAMIAIGVTSDIALRTFGLPGIGWMFDVVEYALYAMTMLGTAYVMRARAHVSVDLLTGFLPAPAEFAVRIVANVICIAICAVFFVFSLSATIGAARENALLFKSFTIPEWMPLSLVPLMFGLLTIELVRQLAGMLAGDTVRDAIRRSDAI